MYFPSYVTAYTMFPVFLLVIDQDVTAETAMRYPELYKDLIKVGCHVSRKLGPNFIKPVSTYLVKHIKVWLNKNRLPAKLTYSLRLLKSTEFRLWCF